MSQYSAAELVISRTLARTIKNRRKALGLSQERVANGAYINRNHYQTMESALSDRKDQSPLNPQLFTLVRLARVLDCSVLELLAEAEEAYEKVIKEHPEAALVPLKD